ncbi:MAG TPA: hypothetical protein VGM01_11110 [Ktedonobacteraceae bacterium]|jgi:hypothetical protein
MLSEQGRYHLDLSPIVPEAQSIARAVTNVYLQHFGQWCIGIMIHGSALKGGFIPGGSDIDFQFYLEPAAFNDKGDLSLERSIALHRDLARIDPAPFQYIQGYALLPQKREGRVGPIPGAYHMIIGTLPVPEATEDELQTSARRALERLDISSVFRPQELLQHGCWKLAQRVRWLCTDVWPTLYHILTIQQKNGIAVWQLSKYEVMKLLPQKSAPAQTIGAFYQAVCAYYSKEASTENALKAIESGLVFLQSSKTWWNEIDAH